MNISKPVERTQTDPLSRTGAGAPVNGAGAPGSSQTSAVEKTAPVDAVRLSQTSKTLVHATGDEPVRADKVEEVRAAIGEGRFEVNSHAVADRLISQAAQLLETLARK